MAIVQLSPTYKLTNTDTIIVQLAKSWHSIAFYSFCTKLPIDNLDLTRCHLACRSFRNMIDLQLVTTMWQLPWHYGLTTVPSRILAIHYFCISYRFIH